MLKIHSRFCKKIKTEKQFDNFSTHFLWFQVATKIMKQMIDQFTSFDLFGRDNYEYYARVTGRVLRVQDEWICSFSYPAPSRGKICHYIHSNWSIFIKLFMCEFVDGKVNKTIEQNFIVELTTVVDVIRIIGFENIFFYTGNWEKIPH